MDIDDDGKEELLINYANAPHMAGMVLYIYDYVPETKEIYIEYRGWPDMRVYDNGYIKENASHNHGRSNLSYFWPYSLLQYDKTTDRYECIAYIDAWCGQYNKGTIKEIIWQPIISKEKYYEMFPSQAVG